MTTLVVDVTMQGGLAIAVAKRVQVRDIKGDRAPMRKLGRHVGLLSVSLVVGVGTLYASQVLAQGEVVKTDSGHTCLLIKDNTMNCWGDNGFGQLGLGDTTVRGDDNPTTEMGARLPLVRLNGLVADFDVGDGHTCAILTNQTVKCWGYNGSGRLGLGDTAHRGDAANEMGASLAAVSLGTGRTAGAITAGDDHNCAILDNGTVKCWGANASGRLGVGDTSNRGDGAGEMGNSLSTVSLGTGRTAAEIDAGGAHTCVLLDNSTVKCWGEGASGKLGQGSTSTLGDGAGELGDSLAAISLGTGRTAVAIAAGDHHTCAILDNATVKCWGEGSGGQHGLGDGNDRGDSANEMGNNLPTVSLGSGRTAVQIAAGDDHTCAILDNGTLKCWGSNSFGQLGLGDSTTRGFSAGQMGDSLPTVSLGTGRTAVAVSAGAHNTCAVLDNADVKCWGNGANGRLGNGSILSKGDGANEMGDNLAAVSFNTVVHLAVDEHVCAGRANLGIKCWGRNNGGQLGVGDTTIRTDPAALSLISLGTSFDVSALGVGLDASGEAHTCAIEFGMFGGAQTKCWGGNGYGELGLGDTNDRGDGPGEMGSSLPDVIFSGLYEAKQIAVGLNFGCVLLDTSPPTVKCWGRNERGNLGQENTTQLGDNSGEMEGNLPIVDLGTGRSAQYIAVGGSVACAILDDGSLKCWGYNANGELGQGDTLNRGDAANEMGDDLDAIALGTSRTATHVSTGGLHVCAVLDNGDVKCWGANVQGELGLGDTIVRGDGSSEMGDNLPIVDLDGANAVKVAAGGLHSCALLDDGDVKCWGANASGQLGLGDDTIRGNNSGEMGANLPPVNLGTGRHALNIDAGSNTVCVVLDNLAVKCWGDNTNGQLGLGDQTLRDDPSTLPQIELSGWY